ncbi:large conductance mechanosensitive channel protein MscL [Lysobacter korlensis]|uniref:Large-conductance mechanosensitive channel n=1 Tax=Lysobacter korlensis TaxID=553636 RepID=A0ABV6RVE4_9GAMM
MLKGFKEFLLRGNVIDLAVAVVIGAAFTAIVNSVVNDIFNPLIGAIFNAESLSESLRWTIRDAPGDENDSVIRFGAVLAALIQFVLVATVVYFALVTPMNWLKRVAFAKQEEGKPAVAADTPPTELELLKDIRDLLADRRTDAAPTDRTPPH